MRSTYVRFVTPMIDEYSGKRRGIFQAVADLLDSQDLPERDRDLLKNLREWFNKNLERPDRFVRSKRRNAEPKAISWFKDFAQNHLERMRAMCQILNEHGVITEMITSSRPGYVVYEDDHQVVAVPFSETTT